ncbi:MAG: UDP-N-acetylglucosamine 2-epimerase (non-hydrolyzing) [Bacteroidetes bacterium]|nr:UDP-N-acetylglucosamine 2-epimerase (non-hydrolyzing) [Bacteroidota bacterium]
MPTILTILGARPQFVKHAAVHRLLQARFEAKTLHTNQHYDYNMSAQFFKELGMPQPDYMLPIGSGTTQGAQTAHILQGIEEVCIAQRPDGMVLYGDTNTTLAGALVAVKMGIPIFHIEAGIRSFNRNMPEEVNRIVADNFSSLLFCPTQEAVDNLKAEGTTQGEIILTGDVMLDTLLAHQNSVPELGRTPFYFATLHRPYNTDVPARLHRILVALNRLDHPVVFPLHPRTAARMQDAALRKSDYPNIEFIEPIGYLRSIAYQKESICVLTDSGGIQKEAYILRKKCITLRSETEWPATLTHGWNSLVFEDVEKIAQRIKEQPAAYEEDMFGDGRAAQKIARALTQFFS